ncbi:hypothetical protein I7I48_08424 [Histoplasma ohiense]|nr:hypothetical protein I7I48_08424 [Histoplasma ohiense (nom. inval.)]
MPASTNAAPMIAKRAIRPPMFMLEGLTMPRLGSTGFESCLSRGKRGWAICVIRWESSRWRSWEMGKLCDVVRLTRVVR